ncbi:MAG: septal ring lytic transglycosylase RlpA family protein [Methylobacter sp.]
MNNLTIFSFVRKMHYFPIFLLIILSSLNACSPDASNPASKPVPKENSGNKPSGHEIKEVGEASWYGPGFENQKTANGETFKTEKMIAASPDLPLGSKAEITNLENGKKTEVRINDRGPYADGRILDLSHAAAKKLGMTEKGKARVKVVAKTHKAKTVRKKAPASNK